MKKERLIIIVFAIAALLHWLPHPANVSPVGALALLSGAYLRQLWMLLLPLPVLLVGHILAGFFDPPIMLAVYAAFLLQAGIGRWFLLRRKTITGLAVAWLLGAGAFWWVTNSAVWAVGHGIEYAHTWGGYLACMANGLPFLARTLAGNLIYIALFFSLIEFAYAKDGARGGSARGGRLQGLQRYLATR